MKQTLYVRPQLLATRQHHLPWAQQLTDWLAQLRSWFSQSITEQTAERVFLFLVLDGKLRRSDPEKVRLLDSEGILRRSEEERNRLQASAIQLALGQLDLDSWRQRLESFARAVEEGTVSEMEMSNISGQLLEQLDNAELVWAAARQDGGASVELRESLDRCIRELISHGELVLAVGLQVQTLAWTFRADLEKEDPILATTAQKFVYFLDLLEEAESAQAVLSPWIIQDLPAELPSPAAEPEQQGRIPSRQPDYALAALPEEENSAVHCFLWESADGREQARMDIPQKPPEDGKLYLEFDARLAEQPVMLGGLRSVIGAEGLAVFAWDDVKAVENYLTDLRVGGQKKPWRRLS